MPLRASSATYLIADVPRLASLRTWVGPETCARAGGSPGSSRASPLLPLVTADPRLAMPPLARLLLGVTPVCAAVGILTADAYRSVVGGPSPSRGAPPCAVNVLGSITGPLLAGFRPACQRRRAHRAGLADAAALRRGRRRDRPPALVGGDGPSSLRRAAWVPVALALAATVLFTTRSFETGYPERQVRRDHTATVIVTGEACRATCWSMAPRRPC